LGRWLWRLLDGNSTSSPTGPSRTKRESVRSARTRTLARGPRWPLRRRCARAGTSRVGSARRRSGTAQTSPRRRHLACSLDRLNHCRHRHVSVSSCRSVPGRPSAYRWYRPERRPEISTAAIPAPRSARARLEAADRGPGGEGSAWHRSASPRPLPSRSRHRSCRRRAPGQALGRRIEDHPGGRVPTRRGDNLAVEKQRRPGEPGAGTEAKLACYAHQAPRELLRAGGRQPFPGPLVEPVEQGALVELKRCPIRRCDGKDLRARAVTNAGDLDGLAVLVLDLAPARNVGCSRDHERRGAAQVQLVLQQPGARAQTIVEPLLCQVDLLTAVMELCPVSFACSGLCSWTLSRKSRCASLRLWRSRASLSGIGRPSVTLRDPSDQPGSPAMAGT